MLLSLLEPTSENIHTFLESSGRFMCWAIAPDVRHLSGRLVNVSFTCWTGTVGQSRGILYFFPAPYSTSSFCPQNNGVAIGCQRRGALKPRGTALQSQMRGER